MAEIVPRWEWRTFGESFGDADSRLAALTPERAEESDEIYLLSRRSDASVKVRAGQMDVKELQQVDDEGLEQWEPVLKAGEPLTADDARTVLSALRADPPVHLREAYTIDQFLAEVAVGPSPDVLAVGVHKSRKHYTVDGAMAELSEVRTNKGSRRTIAVESEDPDRVAAAVRGLGFDPHDNVCLPRGLKAIVGFGGHRYAVLDVGTNSVKFHVAERGADGRWTTIADRAEVTRLGEGLDETGRLGSEPIARTVSAIAGMVEDARQDGVEEIAAVGTAGLRIAPNRDELIDAVRERTGVQIEVIPGEEEARLAYLAATSGLPQARGSLAVFDTGGGSSQFTFGDGRQIQEQFSVNVGAARFTERFGLDGVVDEKQLGSALEAISVDLSRLDGRPRPDTLVGLGGAVTNLAAVKHGLATYDPDQVQGTELDLAEIDRQIELYRTSTVEQRRDIPGLQPKRAEVILAGACIVRTVVTKLGRDSFVVSDRGLRHGLLVERFGRVEA
jgi:exopolyphosphatase / guanosine-5'-triphosphate,3'-diphosphate pyrophosphatase